jgi:hypothetical protein
MMMSNGDTCPSDIKRDEPALKPLGYESIASDETSGPRPRWVYAIVAIYLLVLTAFVTLPVWQYALFGLNQNEAMPVIIFTGCMVACGLALMIVPVRIVRRRQVVRRSIWVPIIASSLLAAALCTGAILALDELYRFDRSTEKFVTVVPIAVWLGWLIVFLLMGRRDPAGIGMQLHRWLIAGSVLELLIAVPSHVIVRRRGECCAGIATGIGICIGVAVMIVAFGPSVLLLYHRRRKQITPRIAARYKASGV